MAYIHFITFANTAFMVPDRIMTQANNFNLFNTTNAINETMIPEFIKKHQAFINSNPKGFGFYIWKPKVILDKLLEINDNDIVVYCDAGVHLNVNGKHRFLEYIDMCDTHDLITFLAGSRYVANQYVKNDAVMYYYPEFNDVTRNYIYAGIMIVKKTKHTIQLIKEWLELCEVYTFIDRSPSIKYKDIPSFSGQDLDNGLFALCVYKHEPIVKFISSNETNIFDQNGYHIHGAKNWHLLEKYPIQCRRDRPKNNGTRNKKQLKILKYILR